MASSEPNHGITVQVIVNGQPLKEYAPPADDTVPPGCRVRYVEVDGTSRFMLLLTLPRGQLQEHDGVRIEYRFDGGPKTVGGIPRDCFSYQSHTRRADGQTIYKNGQRIRQNWSFSPLTIVETEQSLEKEDLGKYKTLGEIKVEVFSARKVLRSVARGGYSNPSLSVADQIPEKCLKGRSITSGIRFDEELGGARPPDAYKWHKTSQTPVAAFIFRYRTHDDLIKSGIIERPNEEDDLQDMTAEQLRAIARNQRNRLEESKADAVRRIKRERQDVGPEDRPAKRRATTEVVDLTGE